jgi:small subunit ribosomal protein S18
MFEERRRRVIDVTTPVDWKNAEWLRRFMTESGRILPRRMTGNSQHRQQKIARAIKRARHMALLPFGGTSTTHL